MKKPPKAREVRRPKAFKITLLSPPKIQAWIGMHDLIYFYEGVIAKPETARKLATWLNDAADYLDQKKGGRK